MYKYNHWIIKGIGLIGVAIFVWIVGVFGYTYVKLVTQPKNPTPSFHSPVDESEFQLTLGQIGFWTCQTGVFNSEENAQKEKARLQELGWDAHIIAKDPFVVGIGLAYSKEEVLPLQELLKEGGVVSIPKSMNSPERAFRIRGSGASETAKVLEGVNLFLNSPYSSRESILPQFENLMLTTPTALKDLREASLLAIRAERTLSMEMRKIMSLHLYEEYLRTLEVLQNRSNT